MCMWVSAHAVVYHLLKSERTEMVPQPEPHGIRHTEVPIAAPPPKRPLVQPRHLWIEDELVSTVSDGARARDLAPLNDSPSSDCICNRPPLTYLDERVAVGPARVGEYGKAQVVPVDDKRGAPQAGHEPCDGECGDAGRVLHEEELGPGQLQQEEAEQLQH
jgi:hypothetical protein